MSNNFKQLKKNKKPLTPEERALVMQRKAVWHFNGGAPSPAVWKSVNPKTGEVTYVTNTHRAYNTAPTLKGAIGRFHNFIKSTASESFDDLMFEKLAEDSDHAPIIAVDFDGTIKKDADMNIYGELNEGCKDALERLKGMGCTLILWTCRSGEELEKAKEYLEKQGVFNLFDKINENVEGMFATSDKIFANYYVDDKNIGGFVGWPKVEEVIMQDKYFRKEGEDMDKIAMFKEHIYKQASILSKTDAEYKLDDFVGGKKNLLLVSGYSGSGKTTLGKDLASQHGAEFIELDDFVRKVDSNPNVPLVKEYFEKNPHLKDKVNEATQYSMSHDYLNFVKDYARKHPDKKFVVEGIQALNKAYEDDLPRIVKGTGMFKSNGRAYQRMYKSYVKGEGRKRLAFSEGLNAYLRPKINTERFVVDKLNKGYPAKVVDDLLITRKNNRLKAGAMGAAGIAAGVIGSHLLNNNEPKKNEQNNNEKVAFCKEQILDRATILKQGR